MRGIGNPALAHSEDTVFLSVDRSMGFDDSGVFIDGEHIQRRLGHTHSTYTVLLHGGILLVIKHLVSRHKTIKLALFGYRAAALIGDFI